MDSCAITDSGKVRSVNQDVCKILEDDERNTAILIVCDGMGGANAGNVASALAAEIFANHLDGYLKQISEETRLDDIADVAADAAEKANAAVYRKGLSDFDCSGMGTTLVALVSTNLGEIVANIGDSRAYHITPNGISQITKDHSVVEDMIDRGEITREQAHLHPRKNLITRAIGADSFVEPDVYMQTIDKGDIVLLCSDGLSNIVYDSEILKALRKNKELGDACKALLKKALSRGAPDNVTVAAFRKTEEPNG